MNQRQIQRPRSQGPVRWYVVTALVGVTLLGGIVAVRGVNVLDRHHHEDVSGEVREATAVPDLRELTVTAAARFASAAGLRVEVAGGGQAGLVRRQDPTPGTLLHPAEDGDVIRVWLRPPPAR